jgi:hypothetical protein
MDQAMTDYTDTSDKLATISIRYEDGDVADREIDLNLLAISLQGFARIISECAATLCAGTLGERFGAPDIRVVAIPVEDHDCFEVLAAVQSIATSKELWSGVFGTLLGAVIQYVLSRRDEGDMGVLKEVIRMMEDGKRQRQEVLRMAQDLKESMHADIALTRLQAQQDAQTNEALRMICERMSAIECQVRAETATTISTSRSAEPGSDERFEQLESVASQLVSSIDRLADTLQPAIRQAAMPINRSCERIDLYLNGTRFASMKGGHGRSFAPEEITGDLAVYLGIIRQFDMRTGECDVILAGETMRIPARVLDRSFSLPYNVYAEAMAATFALSLVARADFDDHGRPVKLYIVGTMQPEPDWPTD